MKNISFTSILCFIILLFTACKSNTQPTENTTAYVKSLEINDLKSLQDKEGVVFLDVRTQGEVDNGALPGMIHIDYNGKNFAEEISKLDKDTEYVVYCQSGIRSAKACKLMEQQGFSKLNDLKGGYKAYIKANN